MTDWLRVVSGMLHAGLAVIAITGPFAAHASNCSDLAPVKLPEKVAGRALEPSDLVGLRDMGSLPDFNEPIFSLSPDRKRLAFQLRQADPDANGYCLGMFVMEARPDARPIMVDHGGQLIRWRFANLLGKSDFPSGFAKVITAQWFPDGNAIAFLKRTGAVTQIWRANADGSGSAPVTHGDFILLAADDQAGSDPIALGEKTGRALFVLEQRVKDRLNLTVAPVIVAQTGQKLTLTEIRLDRPLGRSAAR